LQYRVLILSLLVHSQQLMMVLIIPL